MTTGIPARLNRRIWAHPAQAPDRAIRSNSSAPLRGACGISASIPCASPRAAVSRRKAKPRVQCAYNPAGFSFFSEKLFLFLGVFSLIASAAWAGGGRQSKIDVRTAEGREIWQQEFDLTGVKPGKYNVLITARDAAGNAAESGPFNIRVDPNAGLPSARVVNPEEGRIIRQDFTVIGVASGRFGVDYVMVRLDDREYSRASGSDYWTRPLELAALSEGRHTLYAQAYDGKGTPGPEYAVSFTIDKTAPSVELLSRRAGDVVSGNIVIQGRADDPNGITAVSWSSDGEHFQPLAFKKRRGETAVTFTASVRSRTLEDGPAVYYFRARDGTGLETARPYLFFVDNQGPELEILSPLPEEDVYGRTQVAGRLYDRIGLDRFYYEWAGGQVDIPLRPGDPFWTVTLDISAAESRSSPFRVTAVDKSGNATTVAQRLADNRRAKAPVVVIDYPDSAGLNALPADGAVYGHIAPGFFPASVVMEGAVEYLDARSAFRIPPEMIASGRSSMRLWGLSRDEVLGPPLNVRVNKPAVPPEPAAEGADFQTDLTPSAVTVERPAVYSWVSNNFILEGRAGSAGVRLEYRLNPGDSWRALALGGDQRFSAVVGLSDVEDGPIHLELRTVGGGVGNFPYYHPLNKFSGGPEIGFIAPTPDLGTVHGAVTVAGVVKYTVPLEELAYSLDGGTYTPLAFTAKYDRAFFSFTCDFTALNRRGGVLTVRAVDAGGTVVERTHEAEFDASTDLPLLILNTPADRQVVTGDFEISGVAVDDDGVSAVCWRILTPAAGARGEERYNRDAEFRRISTSQSFQAAVPFSSVVDGENIIEVYAEDVFGVAGEVTARTIRVSTAAPETAVQFPGLDAYNRKAVAVAGSASDANGIAEVLLSMDNGNTYQRAEGRESWTLNLNTESYQDGVYSLLLRTTDAYGIESFANALINIDNTPPEITLGAPSDGDMAGTVLAVSGLAVSGQAHDEVGLEDLTMALVNIADVTKQASFSVDPNFVIQENLDVSRLPEGMYVLKVNGRDYAGNETTVTRNVAISVERGASELALVNPMPGEDHAGPLVVSGRISGAVIPEQITLLIDGVRNTFIPVDRYGVFRYLFPDEQLAGRESMVVSAVFNTPAGERITSPGHEVKIRRFGPAVQVDSHMDGDVVTQRPWLSGRAWVVLTEEEEGLTKREKARFAVRGVEVSFDNGRSFERASGRDQWKIRLETGDLPAGPLPIIIRAEFVDGRTAVSRILLTVDTSPPVVETVEPVENSTHRDTFTAYGAASDDYEIDSVEVSLRPGDKAGYEVPQFIQGLYVEGSIFGATRADVGLGLSFFEDNVKFQFQAGKTAENRRYSGWVMGVKLLANIFYLPFDYFLGPDWAFLSTAFALGANFSYFTMEEGETPVFMGAVLGQVEFIRVDFSRIFPRWKYFKTFSLYFEPIFWFASSDVEAGAIPRYVIGARITL